MCRICFFYFIYFILIMTEVNIDSVSVLFQKAHIQALLENQQAISRWEYFKKENEEIQERLLLFLKKLQVPLMIPVGNKAFFKGHLVHTNDIFICLGDGYFVKGSVEQALDICKRRMSNSDEMLKKLHNEKLLIESRTSYSKHADAFPSPDTPEIIENYNEVEESRWREEHNRKIKEFKQNLAKLKEKEPKNVQSEEDLWKRLDLLEMQEELEDEMNRLGIDNEYNSEDEGEETSDSDSNCGDDSVSEEIEHRNLKTIPKNTVSLEHVTQNVNENNCDSTSNNLDPEEDFIKIIFKHSPEEPVVQLCENITSPYDIYKQFSSAIGKTTKPKKRVSFAEINEVIGVSDDGRSKYETEVNENNFEPEANVNEKFSESNEVNIAFGDVVERVDPVCVKTEQKRPVSKFKASRKRLK